VAPGFVDSTVLLGHVVENRIEGDVVECGVARGGSSALMALVLRALSSDKSVWAFDTFEGIPGQPSKTLITRLPTYTPVNSTRS